MDCPSIKLPGRRSPYLICTNQINQTLYQPPFIVMKKLLFSLCLFAITLSFAFAQTTTKDTVKPAPAPVSPLSTPGMAGPLTINPEPLKVGSIYISGVASGLAQFQNSVYPGDKPAQSDVSNGQVFIQKVDGVFQFFLQVGTYSLPDLGAPYFRSTIAPAGFFGTFPQGFIKLAPTKNFSIEVGKLPTLIGAEYTFSFENMNIQRGLLWNQENAVNRGVQLNYTAGPVTLAVSYNDGLYSNNYNWLWGSLAWTINGANTLAVIGGGSTSRTSISTFVTPLYLNNEQIYNLIYTHTAGQWTIQPYLQYTSVPASPVYNTTQEATTFGAALLASYAVPNSGFSIPFRLEYINSTGSAAGGAPSLIYGPGSNAWSATVTPTYQYKRFFARAELSYVKANNITNGFGLGPNGADDTQSRALLEVGFLF